MPKIVKILKEDVDCFLAATHFPEVGSVGLCSEEFPSGWPIKGGATYQLTYDTETGDVDMIEVT